MKTFLNISIICISAFYFSGTVMGQGVWSYDSTGGGFSSTDRFLERAGATAITVNGEIYVIGFDSLQIFDPINHAWSAPHSAKTYIPSYGYLSASNGFIQGTACEVGGKIYAFGGYSYNSIFSLIPNSLHVLDTSTLTWSEPQTFGNFTPREDLMSCVVNGKIYAIGGNADTDLSGGPVYGIVEIFDPITNTWSTPVTNGSLIPGIGQTASVVNGKIYIIGGSDYNAGPLPSPPCQMFDPSTNTWDTFSSVGLIHRWYATSSALNGKIYYIGGAEGGIVGSWCDTLQVYDPAMDVWDSPTTMGTFYGVSMPASTVVNGKIYVLGGNNGDISNDIQVFTPDSVEDDVSSTVNSSIGLRIFPNPATVDLQILGGQSGEIHIFDLMGRERMNAAMGANTTMDVSSLEAGIYFLRMGSESVRVVVMH